MTEYKYVVQRRYQTELVRRVGGALGRMFEYVNGNSLHINEALSVLTAPKPLTQRQRDKLCLYLLNKAKQDGDKETLAFECVPLKDSIIAGKE